MAEAGAPPLPAARVPDVIPLRAWDEVFLAALRALAASTDRDVAVLGIPDDEMGERVKAFVQLRDLADKSDSAAGGGDYSALVNSG